MSTYLLYFGKSHGFTIKSFDNSGNLIDFDSVITDFDLLESKYITIDQFDNGPVFSKYLFEVKSIKYSMLKLYSHAQAVNGTRVAGSIYGTALISTEDLKISKLNIDYLITAKNNFAKLCLENLKFKRADFTEEARVITKALIEQVQIFDRIETNRDIFFSKQSRIPVAFWSSDFTESMSNAAQKLPFERNKMYFSGDKEHLLRCLTRTPNEFDLYVKGNEEFEKYKSSSGVKRSATSLQGESNGLKIGSDQIESDAIVFKNKYMYYKKQSRVFKALFLGTFILLVSSILSIAFHFFETSPIGKATVVVTENESLKNGDSVFNAKIFILIVSVPYFRSVLN
jgi:hypothetical protein